MWAREENLPGENIVTGNSDWGCGRILQCIKLIIGLPVSYH